MGVDCKDNCQCHRPSEGDDEGDKAMALVEVTVDGANNIGEEAPDEWEEIESFVDSGASATVTDEESVKAVSPSAPDPNKNYRVADGSLIPNKGEKSFLGMTAEGVARKLKAQVTDVDRPLMSVSQVVENGGRVVFDKREVTSKEKVKR